MSSAVQKTTKTYSYRSGAGGGNTDVSIEYSADLSALSRLEVRVSEVPARTANHPKPIDKSQTLS